MATPVMEVDAPATPVQPEPSVPDYQQVGNHKVKTKKPAQRACNQKDEKGKICGGHLKRWFYAADTVEKACGDIEKTYGKNAEIYRCENCKVLYLPNPEEPKASNVAGRGMQSVFGVTVPPKESK
ncbi:MAG TPA: hypothetical protein VN622_02915 [Clostridia bacterium]|nr:hypothetical protein [Clostridia bacterium]